MGMSRNFTWSLQFFADNFGQIVASGDKKWLNIQKSEEYKYLTSIIGLFFEVVNILVRSKASK